MNIDRLIYIKDTYFATGILIRIRLITSMALLLSWWCADRRIGTNISRYQAFENYRWELSIFRNTYTYDRMYFYWIDFDKNFFEIYLNEVTILDSENIHIGWIKVILEKVALRDLSWNYSKKKWSYVVFLGIILKKSRVTWFFWELF